MEQVLSNLTYDELRSIAQDGDVVFLHRTNHWFSRLISAVTGSPFTHVNLAFWANIGPERRLMCVEASHKSKRRIVSMSYYHNRTFTLVRAIKPWESIMTDALSRVGREEYSDWTLLYVGLREGLENAVGWKLPAVDFKYEICSEFVARTEGLDDCVISPRRLFDKLTK
jgi:hypothetical protein